jgi:hypothetical protein
MQQRGGSDRPEADAGLAEEIAAGERPLAKAAAGVMSEGHGG